MQKGLRIKNLKYWTGVENYEEDNSIPNDKLYSVQNVRLNKKIISSKKGFQELGDATAGHRAEGLYEYPYWNSDTQTETKYLLRFINKGFEVYNESTTAFDAVTTNWAGVAEVFTDGINYNNAIYFVNPLDGVFTPAYLIGGSTATTVIATWAGVTDGAFKITIDGKPYNVSGINFAPVATMEDVAEKIQAGIRTATGGTETVTWSVNKFIVSSGNTTADSSITVASAPTAGTDISGAGATTFMDCDVGLVVPVNPGDGIGKINGKYYTPSFLTGGTSATAVPATWAAVTDGSFRINIDGVEQNFDAIDFTGVASMEAVAAKLQSTIRAATKRFETVVWSTNKFIITSSNDTKSSLISGVTTSTGTVGTDISGVGATAFMDCDVGVTTYPVLQGLAFKVCPETPRGTGIESWVERLWVIGDPSAPNAAIASKAALAATPLNIEIFDTTDGALIELIGKGGRNVAIRKLENNLYIWKEDSIWYNTAERIANGETQFIELSRTGGALNQKSTIVVENDVWFLTPGLEVRSLGKEESLGDDPRTKNLTEIIKSTMGLLDPDQSDAVMSYFNRLVKLHLKTRGSPVNNFTIVFDYNTGGWAIDNGQAVHVNAIWSNSLVYNEDSTAGQTFVDETGYSANGTPIVMSMRTGFLDDGRPDTSKRARYIYIRGKLSYYQSVKIRLYRDNYDTYSEYTIPSPYNSGISQESNVSDGQFGGTQFGESQYGGAGALEQDIKMYRFEQLISVDRRSNMYAIGAEAECNGGKVEIEQIILKVIDDNENYKRSDI
mgnify:CR=1 FL=1